MCSCGDSREENWDFGSIFVLLCTVLWIGMCVFATYTNSLYRNSKLDDATVPLLGTASSREPSVSSMPGPETRVWKSPFVVFDLYTNFHVLFERDENRKYQVLDGLRAWSMFWVILGHTPDFAGRVGYFNWFYVYYTNIISFSSNFTLLSANYAVDSFFFLSGFLSTHVLIRKMDKSKGRTPLFLSIAARWLRLVPVYAFVIFFAWNVLPMAGTGPFWFIYEMEITDTCRRYWWTHLLFINNFYPLKYTDQCLPWTWYLANDFQFFAIGTLLVKLHYRSSKLAIITTVLMLVASIAITMGLTAEYNLNFYSDQQQDMIYDKPWSRIQTYLVGVLTCFWLNSSYGKLAPSLTVSNVATVVGLVLMFFSCAGLYWFLQCPENGKAGCWDVETTTIFNGFVRIGWTVPLAMITHFCNIGVKGIITPINAILSLPVWDPLAKMTYGAYLVHPLAMRVYYYQQRTAFYYSVWWLAYTYLGIFVVSYGIAAFLFIVLENPMGSMLSKVMERSTTKKPHLSSISVPSQEVNVNASLAEPNTHGSFDVDNHASFAIPNHAPDSDRPIDVHGTFVVHSDGLERGSFSSATDNFRKPRG
jgi:peptidoglycan/LPS O-acetylase OafA/YrhL